MEPTPVPNSPPKSPINKLVLVGVLALIVGLIVGVGFGKSGTSNPTTSQTPTKKPFFDYQISKTNGKVTKVDNRTLTIQNLSGQTLTIPASNPLYINLTPTAPITDLNQIPLDKIGVITAIYTNGKLTVTGISYLPLITPTYTQPFVPTNFNQ